MYVSTHKKLCTYLERLLQLLLRRLLRAEGLRDDALELVAHAQQPLHEVHRLLWWVMWGNGVDCVGEYIYTYIRSYICVHTKYSRHPLFSSTYERHTNPSTTNVTCLLLLLVRHQLPARGPHKLRHGRPEPLQRGGHPGEERVHPAQIGQLVVAEHDLAAGVLHLWFVFNGGVVWWVYVYMYTHIC